MELIFLMTIASGLVILLMVFALFRLRSSEGKRQQEAAPQRRPNEIPRRAAAARNTRMRFRTADRREDSDEDEDEIDVDYDVDLPEGKIGAKKRAKLEAKAERKAQREAEEKEREERKLMKELEEEKREKEEEKAKLEKERQLEEERKALEEKERREHEEYLKMKEMFSVEEEGFEESESADSEGNLLQEFIKYIQEMKVVVLEDLASHFKMKTQSAIDRIQQLQSDGQLTGVIDDRGKFIYISQQEMEAVAKFVKQRGRVSITELAESSNQLINLNAKHSLSV